MDFSLKYFLGIWIIITLRVYGDDTFVYDYFVYKSVSKVTTFSCEQADKDFQFVRRMSKLGIAVAIGHPRSESYNVADQVARKANEIGGLVLDTRCQPFETSTKLISQATAGELYAAIHIWLIVAWDFDEAKELLNDSTYSPLTDLVLAIGINHNSYELYDVYNPCKAADRTLNITKLGFWRPEIGLDITLTQDKFHRRANLHGMKLRVGVVVKYKPPDVKLEDYLKDHSKKNENSVSSYGFEIIRVLADVYNFTIDIYPFEEWALKVNNTETGMMVDLSKAEIDITASPCSAISRFANYGTLSMPGYPYRTFFILRSNNERLKWTELWTPLALDSWYAVGLAVILLIVIITAIRLVEGEESCMTEFGRAIFIIISVLSQQGLAFVPNKLAGRIAMLCLLFFGVLLLNYYGASIVSARVGAPPDKMNDSLYSLAKSRMKIASEPFFVIDDHLDSRSLVEWEVCYFNERVWKKLSFSKYVTIEEGLKNVAIGEYAYHTSAEAAYPYINRHWDQEAICDMTEIHVITPRVLTFYERFDSPFTEMIKIGLIKTSNVGLQSRLLQRWKPKQPYCSPLYKSSRSISFFEIAPALVLMITGVAVALGIFLIEIIIYKMNSGKS